MSPWYRTVDTALLKGIDDSTSALFPVDRDGIVNLSEIHSRDEAIRRAFDVLDVRFHGITPWFVTKISTERFDVDDDRFGETRRVHHLPASSSSA
jgi:hypothetical protein